MRRGRAQPEYQTECQPGLHYASPSTTAPAYVVEEEAADPTEQRSVDSRHHTAQERPFAFPVVRDRRIRMVQKCTHD